MHIVGRTQTSGGYTTGKRFGSGLKVARLMQNATKGSGMSKEFYSSAESISDKAKVYSPENIKKFDKVKIRSSKPKNYITF